MTGRLTGRDVLNFSRDFPMVGDQKVRRLCFRRQFSNVGECAGHSVQMSEQFKTHWSHPVKWTFKPHLVISWL